MPSDEPRFFKHWDGEDRVWLVYDTTIEEDVNVSFPSDAGADKAVELLNDGLDLSLVIFETRDL